MRGAGGEGLVGEDSEEASLGAIKGPNLMDLVKGETSTPGVKSVVGEGEVSKFLERGPYQAHS